MNLIPRQEGKLLSTMKRIEILLKRIDLYIFFFLMGFVVLTIFPLLKSGYYADDIPNSLLRTIIKLNGINLGQSIQQNNDMWIQLSGRFFPITVILTQSVYYFLSNFIIYKSVILLLTLLNIALFGYFVYQLCRDKFFSFLLMAVVTIFFQFRIYHDALLGYATLMQVLFLFICLSLIFLYFYVKKTSIFFLLLSIFFYISALLMYELSFGFILLVVFCILGLIKDKKRKLVVILCYLIPFGVVLLINYQLRLHVSQSSSYIGTSFVLNDQVWITFLKQLSATLPLSYVWATNPNLIKTILTVSAVNAREKFAAVLTGLSFIFFALKMGKLQNKRLLLLIGASFWILPAAILSVSVKYQSELLWGYGYIPVYFQSFGLLLFSACLINVFLVLIKSRFIRTGLVVGIAVILMYVQLVNTFSNWMVVDKLNSDFLYPKQLLSDALHHDLIPNDLSSNQILVLTQIPDVYYSTYSWMMTYKWTNKYFFYQETGHEFNLVEANLTNKNGLLAGISLNDSYVFKYNYVGQHSGSVWLGKPIPSTVKFSNDLTRTIEVLEVYLYTEGTRLLGKCLHAESDNKSIGIDIDLGQYLNQLNHTIKIEFNQAVEFGSLQVMPVSCPASGLKF